MKSLRRVACALAVTLALIIPGAIAKGPLPIEKIQLPTGFSISVFADNVPNARSMALGDKGTLFVGTRAMGGGVFALRDTNNDGKADEVTRIASGLFMPNGVAFRKGSLFVAEVNRVLRYDNIENNLKDPPQPVVVSTAFPSDRHHGWKFIRFGPDDLLYIPVGAPCNVCERLDDPRYATIMRMKPDGSDLEVYASGIRNTVGFDFHPVTKELWFTDNGRDYLGDELPPDELDYAPHKGMHFGFPYRYGQNVPDPEYGSKSKIKDFTPAAKDLDPHVAALGMRFYTGKMFPAEYHNQIFICEHGSWNRSKKIGYRVMLVKLHKDKVVSYTPFAEGWLQGESAWGRPVDCQVMPDGSLLVSDDHAGAIYRITYKK